MTQEEVRDFMRAGMEGFIFHCATMQLLPMYANKSMEAFSSIIDRAVSEDALHATLHTIIAGENNGACPFNDYDGVIDAFLAAVAHQGIQGYTSIAARLHMAWKEMGLVIDIPHGAVDPSNN